ncbi:MAG TPA: CoA transferase, partial [Hyphomonadaceae bacterium]|nr:CoA transferase [Hyphomonadaceae bacterium]
VQPEQYERLCNALGRADLATDPRFAALPQRMANADALKTELAREFAKGKGETWEARLSAKGVPCGLVRAVPEACELPHLATRSLVQSMPLANLPDGEAARVLNAGYLAGEDGPKIPGPPPRLGEHTRIELAALGYSAAEIDTMIRSGAAMAGE